MASRPEREMNRTQSGTAGRANLVPQSLEESSGVGQAASVSLVTVQTNSTSIRIANTEQQNRESNTTYYSEHLDPSVTDESEDTVDDTASDSNDSDDDPTNTDGDPRDTPLLKVYNIVSALGYDGTDAVLKESVLKKVLPTGGSSKKPALFDVQDVRLYLDEQDNTAAQAAAMLNNINNRNRPQKKKNVAILLHVSVLQNLLWTNTSSYTSSKSLGGVFVDWLCRLCGISPGSNIVPARDTGVTRIGGDAVPSHLVL